MEELVCVLLCMCDILHHALMILILVSEIKGQFCKQSWCTSFASQTAGWIYVMFLKACWQPYKHFWTTVAVCVPEIHEQLFSS